jgi:hypothetical protein
LGLLPEPFKRGSGPGEFDTPRSVSSDTAECDPAGPWLRNVRFELPLVVARDQDQTIHALSVVDRRFVLWRSSEGALEPRLARRRPVPEGRLHFEARGKDEVWALTLSSADEPLHIESHTRNTAGHSVVTELTPVDEGVARALELLPLEVQPHVVVHRRDVVADRETYVFAPYPTAGAREFRAFHGRGGTLVELPRAHFEPDRSGGGFMEFSGEISLTLTRAGARGDWQVEGTPEGASKRRLSSEFDLAQTTFACLAPKARRFRLTQRGPERQLL